MRSKLMALVVVLVAALGMVAADAMARGGGGRGGGRGGRGSGLGGRSGRPGGRNKTGSRDPTAEWQQMQGMPGRTAGIQQRRDQLALEERTEGQRQREDEGRLGATQ